MGMARGLEILAQLLNSGVREEKQTARKFMNLRAVRWTVWDWPRGGHSTWPLTATLGSGTKAQDRSPRMAAFARPTRCLHLYSPA